MCCGLYNDGRPAMAHGRAFLPFWWPMHAYKMHPSTNGPRVPQKTLWCVHIFQVSYCGSFSVLSKISPFLFERKISPFLRLPSPGEIQNGVSFSVLHHQSCAVQPRSSGICKLVRPMLAGLARLAVTDRCSMYIAPHLSIFYSSPILKFPRRLGEGV